MKGAFMKIIKEEEITDLADLFKIFSDSTRLRILFSLMDGEKNVTELTQDLDMTQSNVSHSLSILKTNNRRFQDRLLRTYRAKRRIRCSRPADNSSIRP